MTAQVLVSDIGVDMSRFPTAGNLVSWVGLCPRNDESAGKRRSTRLRQGAPWLKSTDSCSVSEVGISVEATRDEVLRTFPAGTRVNQAEGGFVLWIQLPERYNGLEIQRRVAATCIHILAGEWFSPTKQYRNYIRISCGHPFEVIQPFRRLEMDKRYGVTQE